MMDLANFADRETSNIDQTGLFLTGEEIPSEGQKVNLETQLKRFLLHLQRVFSFGPTSQVKPTL